MPYYQDNHIQIFNKDCRSMGELPGESVQMVCTSPPYWGLRKYADLPDLVWGDNQCEHQWGEVIETGDNRFRGMNANVGSQANPDVYAGGKALSSFCSLCGAWKGSYGLEPTPEMYIEHTILILREIRRVLRKDGVVFWNIGDSYFGSWADYSGKGRTAISSWARKAYGDNNPERPPTSYPNPILKPKDLCLIPFRVAIAAQEDGWWVRSVIIWSKPNPMPESVTDRPTESHEYILMLTKSGTTQYWTHPRKRGNRTQPKPDYIWVHKRTKLTVDYPPVSDRILREFWTRCNLWRGHDYYWDADAVREPVLPQTLERYRYPFEGSFIPGYAYPNEPREHPHGWKNLKVRGMKTKGQAELDGQEQHHGQDISPQVGGRNIRSVWEFPTQPYPEAHFAVFPDKLPETCIKAATPEVGCCSKCGAPWERVRENTGKVKQGWGVQTKIPPESGGHEGLKTKMINQFETIGWRPTCSCNADRVPSIVLDPFAGAGTTLWVAKKLGRKAVGYELSEEYCQLALERNRQQALDFNIAERR